MSTPVEMMAKRPNTTMTAIAQRGKGSPAFCDWTLPVEVGKRVVAVPFIVVTREEREVTDAAEAADAADADAREADSADAEDAEATEANDREVATESKIVVSSRKRKSEDVANVKEMGYPRTAVKAGCGISFPSNGLSLRVMTQ